MADDVLDMRARVIDEFSSPLRKLRDQLLGIKTPADLAKVNDHFRSLEKSAERAGAALKNGFGAALSVAGVGALSFTAAAAGAVAALRGFSSNTAEMHRFSQETGLSVQRLRELNALGARVGIDATQVSGGIKRFADSMVDLRRRRGELYDELRRAGPGGQELAEKLVGSKSVEEALGNVLSAIENTRDGALRARLGEAIFGSSQFGRFGEDGPGSIRKKLEEIRKAIGVIGPDGEKAAKELEDSFSRLREQIEGVLTSIGEKALPALRDVVKQIGDELSKIDWKGFGENVAKSIHSVVEELKTVDWKAVAGGIGSAFSEVAQTVRDIHGLIKDIKDWYNDPVGKLKQQARPQGSIIGPMREDSGPILQRADQVRRMTEVLDEIIARRKADGLDTTAQEAKRQALTDEMKKLREQLEKMNQGATVQQQSFNGSGFGSLIQNASLGGAAGSGVREQAQAIRRTLGGRSAGSDGTSGNAMLDFIAKAEGTHGNYNETLGYGLLTGGAQNLTGMSLDEIDALQTRMLSHPANRWNSSAVGRYQIVRKTLRALRAKLGLKGSDRYDPAMQDFLAKVLLRQRGGNIAGLRQEWQGLNRRSDEDIRRALGGTDGTRGPGGDTSGLRMKPGAADGGAVHEGMTEIARRFQDLGLTSAVTALNDRSHKGRRSWHNQGLAGDFRAMDPRQSAETIQKMIAEAEAAGLKAGRDFGWLNEYTNPSRHSTGPHLHFNFRSAEAAARYAEYARRLRAERDAQKRGPAPERLGDEIMRRRFEAVPVRGEGHLQIDLNGFPAGTKTKATATGMFREVKLNRGAIMAGAEA